MKAVAGVYAARKSERWVAGTNRLWLAALVRLRVRVRLLRTTLAICQLTPTSSLPRP